MEVKMENLLNVFPDLSAEEQTELQARLAKTIEAARQNVFKDKQHALTEAFFNLLEPARRKQLEAEVHALQATKDADIFRAQILLMLLAAFHNGMLYELGLQKLTTNAVKKDH